MALPPGLLLNPATGELTGVPTVAGDYVIALKVRDALGSVRELTDSLTINPYTPMHWSGAVGPLMETRPATGITLALSFGLGPYTFAVFSGALPDGLTINASTGVVSGTPTTPGPWACMLRATDTLSQHADLVLAGTVAANLTVDYIDVPQGTVSVAMSDIPVVAGGTAPITYAINSGTLPPGLVFDPIGGHYSGYPTAPNAGTIVIRATDAAGFITDTSITFDIAAHPTLSGTLPHATAGKAYTGSFTGALGHTPYGWTMATLGGAGLSINASTGAITGTPVTATPGYILDVTMTDALGVTAERNQSIVVAAALTISGTYAANSARGALYSSFAPTTTGGWGPFTYAISAGSLPTGLTLNASTGVISGTTTTQGVFTATLRVTDADGSTATMAFNVTVAGDLSITGSAPNFGTTTVAYSGDTLAGAGGATPYSWSIAVGALPPGMSLNPANGDLSGTPTTPGTYNFTVRVTDANTSFAQTALTITVAAFPALTGTLPDASTGAAYSAKYAASGGHAPLAFDISAGSLPTGLSINSSDGTISGTPSAAGTFNFTVRATDAHGNVTTRAGTVVAYAPPSISGTVASASEVGVSYSDTSLSASAGKAPLSWSVQGTLPPGMSMSGSSGAISGTPTTSGTYAFTAKVTDALGRTSTSSQTITVVDQLSLSTTTTQGTRTIAYSASPGVRGGSGSKSYAIGSGTLPGGLSLNAGTGVISGTPTAAGTFSYTLVVTDALGATSSATISTVIANPVDLTLTTPAPNGTIGVAYSYAGPPRTGGFGPFSYTLASGSLPAGTTMDSSTGVISGTPTTAATYTPTIRVTDLGTGGGSTDTQGFTIVIAAAPVLSLTYPHGTVGQAYSGTASVSGGHSPFTYAKALGTLPPGLTLNASTGALSGTPTTSQTLDSTIRATDALGNNSDANAHIAIAPALVINDTLSDGKQGVAYSSTLNGTGGWGTRTFAKTAGTLPTGLSLSSAGALAGTPSAIGTFNFTVTMTDGDGNTVAKAMTVVIAAAAAMNVTASPNPAFNQVVSSGSATARTSTTASVTGNTGAVTHSWAFVSASGTSSPAFTPSGQGTATLSVQATANGLTDYGRTEVWRDTVHDSGGHTDTVDVSLTLAITNSV